MITLDYIDEKLVAAFLLHQAEIELELVACKYELTAYAPAPIESDKAWIKKTIAILETKLKYIDERINAFRTTAS